MSSCAICALVSAAVAGMIAGGVAVSELFGEGGDDDHDKQVLNEETPIDVSTTNPLLLTPDRISFSGAIMSTTWSPPNLSSASTTTNNVAMSSQVSLKVLTEAGNQTWNTSLRCSR